MSNVFTQIDAGCCCPNCAQGTRPDTNTPQELGNTSLFEQSTSNAQGSSYGSVISGYAWDNNTITYAFPDSSNQYTSGYLYNEPFQGFSSLNNPQKSALVDIMQHIESFTNLTFVEGSKSTADIKVAQSDVPSVAWGYYPGAAQESGDIWLNADYAQLDLPQLGNYAYMALMHEFGHALGLKHSFDSENGNQPVHAQYDAMSYTLMSYSSHTGSNPGFYTNEENGYAQSFMMLDIASLQTMYGANFDYNNGNTTYSWNPNSGEMFVNGIAQGTPIENRVFSTIWDGDGYDVYDLSNYTTDMVINLNAGQGSVFNASQLVKLNAYEVYTQNADTVYADFNVMNALQIGDHTGSLIDAVNGGSGHDVLIGNYLDNVIRGNDGDDIIYGDSGNDILIGGRGNDAVYGGDGFDTAIFQNTARNSTLELREDGTVVVLYDTQFGEFDTFAEVERVVFSDRKLAFDTDGNAGKAYRLYQATFDRTPDEDGLGFWITALDNGLNINDISQQFVESNEFQSMTGLNPTSDVFVNAMYNNVLQRDADQIGQAYWQEQMDNGMSRADVLLEFSESAENIGITSHAVDDGIWFV